MFPSSFAAERTVNLEFPGLPHKATFFVANVALDEYWVISTSAWHRSKALPLVGLWFAVCRVG
jgi:hypothetical protein